MSLVKQSSDLVSYHFLLDSCYQLLLSIYSRSIIVNMSCLFLFKSPKPSLPPQNGDMSANQFMLQQELEYRNKELFTAREVNQDLKKKVRELTDRYIAIIVHGFQPESDISAMTLLPCTFLNGRRVFAPITPHWKAL